MFDTTSTRVVIALDIGHIEGVHLDAKAHAILIGTTLKADRSAFQFIGPL